MLNLCPLMLQVIYNVETVHDLEHIEGHNFLVDVILTVWHN